MSLGCAPLGCEPLGTDGSGGGGSPPVGLLIPDSFRAFMTAEGKTLEAIIDSTPLALEAPIE